MLADRARTGGGEGWRDRVCPLRRWKCTGPADSISCLLQLVSPDGDVQLVTVEELLRVGAEDAVFNTDVGARSVAEIEADWQDQFGDAPDQMEDVQGP